MRNLLELGLLGLLLTCKEKPNKENNPVLVKMIDNLGFNSYWEDDQEELKKEAFNIIDSVERHFDYFESSELKVNSLLNNYIYELYEDHQSGFKEDPRSIAIKVCALGNKLCNDDDKEDSGADRWIKYSKELLEDLRRRFTTLEEVDYLPLIISRIKYVNTILEILDIFVTSHNGMLAGVEEFVPNDYNDVYPLEDWVVGNECGQVEDCGCGCQLDKPITILQGMEDYLGDKESEATRYLGSIYFSNDFKLLSLQGNEEGVMDSIKDMGTKAYQWCKEVLDSFMDLFSSDDSKEEVQEAESAGDINKKALQAISNKGLKVKPAAKEGALALARANDPTGGVVKVVSSLNTIGDGSRVIDGLTSLLTKALNKGGKLDTKLQAAKKAVDDLQATNSKNASSSTDNKQAAANTKALLQEKIKVAKQKLKEVKAEAGAQKKITSCIQRTIKGITPKIFMDEDNKTPGQPAPKKTPKE